MVTGRTGPLRLGLIGAGRWGLNYIRTIAQLDSVKLVALTGRSPEAAAAAGPECAVLADWRALLEFPRLDGVIVSTPAETHFEIASAALGRRLPTLVEKPLTTRPEEARRLAELALAGDTPLLTDHVYLFHPGYRALRARLAGQRVRGVVGVAGNAGPRRPDVSVLWDWGPHDVAMCLDLLAAPPTTCRLLVEPGRTAAGEAGESIALSLEFEGGVSAELRMSNLLATRTRVLTVRTDAETLVFEDGPVSSLTVTPLAAAGERLSIEFSSRRPLAVAVGEFADAIRDGHCDAAAINLALAVVEVLARCEASAS